jgi:translation initiation factor 3 subunit M
MASFINLNDSGLLDADQKEAVKHVSEILVEQYTAVKGDAAAKSFEEKFAKLYEADAPGPLLDHLVEAEAVLIKAFEQTDAEDPALKKEARDRIEALYAVLFSLFVRLTEQEQGARLDGLVKRIVASENESPLRMRLLMTLFNALGVRSKLRAVAFRALLEYGQKVGSGAALLPYCALLEEWMEDWQLPRGEKKNLHVTVARMYFAAGRPDDSLAMLHTCLKLYEASDSNLAEATDAAVAFIAQAIAAPKVLDVGDLLALRAVGALAKTKEGEKLVALLQLFRDGSLSGLKEFRKKNEKLFEEHGVSYDACESKMKLLTLSSLAGSGTELPLADVAAKLGLTEDEAERWVVRAVTSGFLGARVDQMRRVVLVKSAFQRTFEQPEWAKLHDQLGRWIRNLERLQGALATTKAA